MPARSRSDTSQETSSAWAPEVTTAGIETVDQVPVTLPDGLAIHWIPCRKDKVTPVLSLEGGRVEAVSQMTRLHCDCGRSSSVTAALRVRQNQAIEAGRLGGGWIRDLHVASVDRSRGDHLPIDQVRRGLKHQRTVGWALQPQSEALGGCT